MRPAHGVPETLRHLNLVPVRSLYGCVMSFRLPLARAHRFDENLTLYSYMEDFEMSYRIGKQYALLRCPDAAARHVRVQSGRLHPSVVTYLCLVNVAYIGRRVMDWTPALQRHLERYARRSVHLELIRGCFRKTGFSHYRGARAGLKDVLEIVRAPGTEVPALYIRAAEEGFRHGAY
jgi:GT2 family glycosyltransferase